MTFETLEEVIKRSEECSKVTKTALSKLKQKVEEIESFKVKCSVSKTFGTVANVVGAGGILLSPFTAGTSAVVTGLVALAGGIVTNAYTDLVNSSETKEFIKEIERLNNSRSKEITKFEEACNVLYKEVEQVMGVAGEGLFLKKEIQKRESLWDEKLKISKNAMWLAALAGTPEVGTGLFLLEKTLNAITTFPGAKAHVDVAVMQSYHAITAMLEGTRTAQLAAEAAEAAQAAHAIQAVNAVAEVAAAGVQMASGSTKVAEGYTAITAGAEVASKMASTSTKVFRMAGPVITVACVAVDVALLIKEWVGEQPAAGYANRIIESLTEEMRHFQKVHVEVIRMREMIYEAARQQYESVSMAMNESVETRVTNSGQTQVRSGVRTETRAKPRLTSPVSSSASSCYKECNCKIQNLSVLYINMQSMRPTKENQRKASNFKNQLRINNPDIVVIVETWLSPQLQSEAVLRFWGLQDFDFRRYDRSKASNQAEAERNGGGILACWNRKKHGNGTFDFTEDFSYHKSLGEFDNHAVRFFIITKAFNCMSVQCEKVGLGIIENMENMMRQRRYAFVVGYRRPAPLNATKEFQKEHRADFNYHNQNLKSITTEFFEDGLGFRHLGYDGAVLVGDYNWTDSVWARQLLSMPGLQRVEFSEPTTNRNSSPDVVAAIPLRLIQNSKITPADIGTVHKVLPFRLYFGKDFDDDEFCELCWFF